jgi:predicted RNA binding protein YcfA (HicA-like mRNA interferase family)
MYTIMKKRDVEAELKKLGWWLKREGSNHEIWTNGHLTEPLPRHTEINELLAKKILRLAKMNPPSKEK